MQPTVQEMHFYKLVPRHQIHTAVQIWVFIKSHYSQIAYWILNIVFTLRLIEAFCFQTVSCNVFKQKKCSAIHFLQPVCDFHHRRNREYAFYADAVYKQSAFSFPSRETKVILGQETAKDQIIPYSWWKPTQNLHRKQRKSSEITIL